MQKKKTNDFLEIKIKVMKHFVYILILRKNLLRIVLLIYIFLLNKLN